LKAEFAVIPKLGSLGNSTSKNNDIDTVINVPTPADVPAPSLTSVDYRATSSQQYSNPTYSEPIGDGYLGIGDVGGVADGGGGRDFEEPQTLQQKLMMKKATARVLAAPTADVANQFTQQSFAQRAPATAIDEVYDEPEMHDSGMAGGINETSFNLPVPPPRHSVPAAATNASAGAGAFALAKPTGATVKPQRAMNSFMAAYGKDAGVLTKQKLLNSDESMGMLGNAPTARAGPPRRKLLDLTPVDPATGEIQCTHLGNCKCPDCI
jgi:hypothetical protein